MIVEIKHRSRNGVPYYFAQFRTDEHEYIMESEECNTPSEAHELAEKLNLEFDKLNRTVIKVPQDSQDNQDDSIIKRLEVKIARLENRIKSDTELSNEVIRNLNIKSRSDEELIEGLEHKLLNCESQLSETNQRLESKDEFIGRKDALIEALEKQSSLIIELSETRGVMTGIAKDFRERYFEQRLAGVRTYYKNFLDDKDGDISLLKKEIEGYKLSMVNRDKEISRLRAIICRLEDYTRDEALDALDMTPDNPIELGEFANALADHESPGSALVQTLDDMRVNGDLDSRFQSSVKSSVDNINKE